VNRRGVHFIEYARETRFVLIAVLRSRKHGIDPYASLVDVLQRISDNPLKSDLQVRLNRENFGRRKYWRKQVSCAD